MFDMNGGLRKHTSLSPTKYAFASDTTLLSHGRYVTMAHFAAGSAISCTSLHFNFGFTPMDSNDISSARLNDRGKRFNIWQDR